jgi:hypothetical protein
MCASCAVSLYGLSAVHHGVLHRPQLLSLSFRANYHHARHTFKTGMPSFGQVSLCTVVQSNCNIRFVCPSNDVLGYEGTVDGKIITIPFGETESGAPFFGNAGTISKEGEIIKFANGMLR